MARLLVTRGLPGRSFLTRGLASGAAPPAERTADPGPYPAAVAPWSPGPAATTVARMRRPSARMRPNTVLTQRTGFVPDRDGGRQLVPLGLPSSPIRCRVHPASAKDVPDHMREEGVEYLTVHFFGADPGLATRDLVAWSDFSPAKVLSALGPPRTASGQFTTWLVDCEYRVPPGPEGA